MNTAYIHCHRFQPLCGFQNEIDLEFLCPRSHELHHFASYLINLSQAVFRAALLGVREQIHGQTRDLGNVALHHAPTVLEVILL